ncbi:MAG: hypothetical protein A2283_15225 [Lentisphaerae bacterium RIFOXYA12_FULL_48_11]|nr:MAG: hypothetical protein A2283_15225 [Lentisphaerae bacterium RIFOXYA12_FULL_48_11]
MFEGSCLLDITKGYADFNLPWSVLYSVGIGPGVVAYKPELYIICTTYIVTRWISGAGKNINICEIFCWHAKP